ncbi:MAG: hypothetical protein AB1782_18230 [Cyanobacteriota bacterium]
MTVSKIKIRPIRLLDKNQTGKFLKEVNVAVNSSFNPDNYRQVKGDIVRKVHSYLPLNWRFLQETYVAVDNKEIIGIIGLIHDCRLKQRWKINQLLLKPHSYEVGKLLIDYIVNKYGAEGVETFLSEVDSGDTDAQDLFKNACGFRQCTVNHLYQFNLEGKLPEEVILPDIRTVSLADNAKLFDLYLECLTPQTKISLEKSVEDFSFSLTKSIKDKINGLSTESWILENPENKSAIAYATSTTTDNRVFYINIITSLPYTEYFRDILYYLARYAGLKNKNSTLLINICEAIQGHKKYAEILKDIGIPDIQTTYVLVKDYWRPLKERKPIATPIIIFPEGTSPACNSLNMVKK